MKIRCPYCKKISNVPEEEPEYNTVSIGLGGGLAIGFIIVCIAIAGNLEIIVKTIWK